MPEGRAATDYLCGGRGPVGFAVDAAEVELVVAEADLPPTAATASASRLVGDPPGDAGSARFARIRERRPDAYLDLGDVVVPRTVPPERCLAIPRFVARAAARWGWRALFFDEGPCPVRLVLDAPLLARLASPRREPPLPPGKEAS